MLKPSLKYQNTKLKEYLQKTIEKIIVDQNSCSITKMFTDSKSKKIKKENRKKKKREKKERAKT